MSRHETHEKAHGQDETRVYYLCPVPEELPDRERWPELKALGMSVSSVIRESQNKREVRFYILSKKLSARCFGEAVRGN